MTSLFPDWMSDKSVMTSLEDGIDKDSTEHETYMSEPLVSFQFLSIDSLEPLRDTYFKPL